MDFGCKKSAVLRCVKCLVTDLFQLHFLPANLLYECNELAWSEDLGEDLDIFACRKGIFWSEVQGAVA